MATLERITDTTEEINVEAVFPRTDIASQNIPEQDTPTRPQITELSEDQICWQPAKVGHSRKGEIR